MSAVVPDLDRRSWMIPSSAVLLMIAVARLGAEPRLVPALYLALVAPALAVIDVRERRLPNRLVLPAYPLAVGGIVGQLIVSGELPMVAIVSGLVYGGVFLMLALVGGMGMGDVKLAGVLGLSAGLAGEIPALVAPVAAFLLGGLVSLGAVCGRRATSIPFGPCLLAGFWVALAVA